MSHMSKIELVIKDAEVLKQACRHLNMEYSSDTAKFIGRGCNVEAQALAVVAVLGAKHVISVVPEGESAYVLRSTIYENARDFEILNSSVGRLKQRYAVEHVLAEAQRKRMRVQEITRETGVRLILTTY